MKKQQRRAANSIAQIAGGKYIKSANASVERQRKSQPSPQAPTPTPPAAPMQNLIAMQALVNNFKSLDQTLQQ